MDPEKVEAILSWETPSSVKDVQFARPLAKMTKGEHFTARNGRKKMRYQPFEWNERRQAAFEALKSAFTSAPILVHFDPSKEIYVETDASDFVTAGVLSHIHGDVLKSVAFFSKKMTSAECNYQINDKELLAIIRSFETWEPELMSNQADQLVKVLSDHKSLEYFMSTKQLTSRQVSRFSAIEDDCRAMGLSSTVSKHNSNALLVYVCIVYLTP
ncbi:Elys-like domain containing protein [Lasiodiplodia theobromae]|uniref:Elys-like domain containing protein n=1 Tax=Lasiodiplodia theobromae TaxID=45133 RepID=UPI0015C37B40|nr:Elys-like domain containing protein [Lasiodiplodia theobromae]KAF4537812.1 Elys-like domain containing protein [Lasiodiplodia theobromae]